MRIGIYNEGEGSAIGGGEFCVATLASALSREHDVEVIHHFDWLDRGEMSRTFGVSLDSVAMRYEQPNHVWFGASDLPWRRYLEERRWHANLSRPYDLFVVFTHALPPFCCAPVGALYIHFPGFDRHSLWPWAKDIGAPPGGFRNRLRRLYYEWDWRQRFATYQIKLANSAFTQYWSRIWWDIEVGVLHPPSEGAFQLREKSNQILSVSRFAPYKKQLEMVKAFSEISREADGWEFKCAGGVVDRSYLEAVRNASAKTSAEIIESPDHTRLRELYERSSIFWHAMGYGVNQWLNPVMAEHFGIVTVEAMSAGCVPVVINKGGQPEIVQHGVNGFLWESLDELKEYTLLLIRDSELRLKMSDAARERAKTFGCQRFVGEFMQHIQPYTKRHVRL
jgi:glycosyltransferase involved in cell wall biosynthesis